LSTFPSCLIHLSKRTKIHTPPCILRRFGQAAFSTRFAQGGSDTHQPHHASILRHRAPGRHHADDTVHSRFGRAAFSSPSCLIHPPLWVADDRIPKRTKIHTPPRILRRFRRALSTFPSCLIHLSLKEWLMTETRNGPKFIPHHVFCGGSGRQHFPHVSRKEFLTPTCPITLPYYDIMHRAATVLTTLFIRGSGGQHTPVPSCLIHPSLAGCSPDQNSYPATYFAEVRAGSIFHTFRARKF
jgi:hypothetical protein